MGATDRFSPEDIQRILGLTEKQLEYWERLRLVAPEKIRGVRTYNFRDLIGLRTVKQLAEQGVPANRLRRALAALREKLSNTDTPLTQLRILSDGKDVVVESGGTRLEPLSGQFVMNFEVRELDEQVQEISGWSADDWLAAALEYESAGRNSQAIDAYERALLIDAQKLEALMNCGTLHYENGNLKKASEYFQRALRVDNENALGHFNLGSVLDDLGDLAQAREHLRRAVQLTPDYADARYNLAFVCEELNARNEARDQWVAYLRLEPAGPWADFARKKLAVTPISRPATPKS
jgi:tetratricopeptide (TPR) repeat protein